MFNWYWFTGVMVAAAVLTGLLMRTLVMVAWQEKGSPWWGALWGGLLMPVGVLVSLEGAAGPDWLGLPSSLGNTLVAAGTVLAVAGALSLLGFPVICALGSFLNRRPRDHSAS